MPRRDERAHVERRAHRRAAAMNHALPAEHPAVPIERRDAHEGRDRLPVERAELRQRREDRERQHGTHARRALEQVIAFAPDRTPLHELGEIRLGAAEFAGQICDVRGQAFLHPRPPHQARVRPVTSPNQAGSPSAPRPPHAPSQP